MPRNSSGTYTLPAGNPVVTGTTISSTWANTTLSDLATAMSDSLDRSGQGGMLASLGLFSGVIGAPGLSWTAETTSGLYRAGAGDFRYSISSTDKLQLITTGLGIPAAGVAATPSLFILGDPNTGVYSVAADDLGISTGGVLRFDISTTAITATLPWRGQDGSSAAPAVSFSGDTDTGIYRVAANDMAVVTGGIIRGEWTATTFVSSLPILNQSGSAAAPPYTFSSDSLTGVFLLSSSQLGFTTGGTRRGYFFNTGFVLEVAIRALDGSVGSPGYTFDNDPDTGIYRVASNNVRISAGGIDIFGFANSAGVATPQFFGQLQAVSDGTAGAPAYSFANDTDTGLYRVTANQLGISVGGSNIANFTSTFGLTFGGSLGIQNNDGSVSAPTYTFFNDTDTGLYRPGTDDAALVAGGANGIRITKVGAVVAVTIGSGAAVHDIKCSTATSASAGGVASLPATVEGFINIAVNGASKKIPYYPV